MRNYIYRQSGLVYRRVFPDATNAPIYRELSAGDANEGGLSQPLRRAVTLRLYDTSDILRGIISSNAQFCPIIALTWEMLDTGCGSFDLELAQDYGLQHGWRVDIHLWNDPLPAYGGFIQQLPVGGGTPRSYSYSGYGGMALLDRVFITATYPAQTVQGIVLQLARVAEAQIPRLQVLSSQVSASTYSTLGELRFLRTPVKQALKQAGELAGDFQWGVDAQRRFFFKPVSAAVDWHGWVGKHLETYAPREDSSNIANRIYTKGGKTRSDLDPAHPLYKTNWVEDVVEDVDSQELYGVCSTEYSAPSTLNLIDALRGAGQELRRRKDPRKFARVEGLEFTGVPLTVTGKARVVGRGGQELLLPKKRLRYQLYRGRVKVEADFGDIDYAASDVLAQISARAASESLARQNSQRQM